MKIDDISNKDGAQSSARNQNQTTPRSYLEPRQPYTENYKPIAEVLKEERKIKEEIRNSKTTKEKTPRGSKNNGPLRDKQRLFVKEDQDSSCKSFTYMDKNQNGKFIRVSVSQCHSKERLNQVSGDDMEEI